MRKVKRALEASALPLNERFQNWCSFFPGAAHELLTFPHPEEVEEAVAAHFRSFLTEAHDATPLSRLLYLNFCTYLPEDLLVKMDRTTMAHGLEARSPFLDTALVEFAAKLPDKYKLRGFSTKYVLRKTFDDLIPPAILRRGKMGFGVPLGAWFRGPSRPFLMEHLESKDSRLYSHVRREAVTELLEGHLTEKRDYGQQLFCLLTLEIWLRSL
jgi:asparagine synthase (glutamine-hydrolysing)